MAKNKGYIKYSGYGFTKVDEIPEPMVNVIDSYTFKKVVSDVFDTMADCLEPSLGPSGGSTAISNFPYFHSTKDGYSIMKNIEFADPIHKIVAMVIQDICTRLNNTVGDGTTTSVIATNALYQAYFDNKDKFDKYQIREVLDAFQDVKNMLIEYISKTLSRPIGVGTDDFIENIRRIVYISTNGDDKLTDIITDMYQQINYPAIEVVLGNGGETVGHVVEGFQIDTCLTDQIYINNDEKTMRASHVDVLVFDHKITSDIYEKFIKIVTKMSAMRGRKLMVIAPFYDEVLLNKTIAPELTAEYTKTKNINLILMRCSATSAANKKKLSDLAMLLNTEIVTSDIEKAILERLDTTDDNIDDFVNIDNRNIVGINVVEAVGDKYKLVVSDGSDVNDNHDFIIRLGHVDNVNAGLKKSVFTGFYYDEDLYKKHFDEANTSLQDAIDKYSKLGTFNTEITRCRSRVNSLGLKMGIIEVGGDTMLAQNFLKDTIDDAVHAAESAYNHGYILGGNVSILTAVDTILNETTLSSLNTLIFTLISQAFTSVYDKVLREIPDDDIAIRFDRFGYFSAVEGCPEKYENAFKNVSLDMVSFAAITGAIISEEADDTACAEWPLRDFIIIMSYMNNKVFDLRSNTFTDSIINSTQTDIEILNATMDLLALLISGNQLVVRGRSEYADAQ